MQRLLRPSRHQSTTSSYDLQASFRYLHFALFAHLRTIHVHTLVLLLTLVLFEDWDGHFGVPDIYTPMDQGLYFVDAKLTFVNTMHF